VRVLRSAKAARAAGTSQLLVVEGRASCPITRIVHSGLVGGNPARAAIGYGYDVVISNARGPWTLAGLLAELGPKAWAATAVAAAASATSRSWRFPTGIMPCVQARGPSCDSRHARRADR
jgi:hypothetical protein